MCLRKGLRDKAKEALERILTFAPGDSQATQWLRDFDRRAEELAKAEKEAQAPAEKSATAMVVAAAPPAAMERKKSSGVGTTLHVEIKQIRRVEGVRGTILIDPYGLVIASDLPEQMDEDLVAALLTNISRALKEHANALTIGEFEDGIIESAQTRIHVLNVSDMTMGVFATPETKTGLLLRAVHNFAERVIEQYR
ncbi:MAG: roadblock/LC7 domain-containing protein [Planctomycetota bacterium]|nr:roadblock/LC7 domain-containing protein [Planctomycetota bacterium]